MKGLIDEVLLLGRVESGRMECRRQPLDLVTLARRVVADVTHATEHACPVELVAGDDLAAAELDETLTAIILTNLLGNAVKYSSQGKPVRLTLRRGNGEVVFEVRDEGLGIPTTDHAELFKPFHRGGNVGAIAGTGLGLTIVKRCVDLHCGSIVVSSQVGQGTTFTIRLPA